MHLMKNKNFSRKVDNASLFPGSNLHMLVFLQWCGSQPGKFLPHPPNPCGFRLFHNVSIVNANDANLRCSLEMVRGLRF